MNTPTPRTDAAWAKTFQDDEDQCRAGNAATDMRDECATLERELAALAAERDQLRAQLHALNLVCGTTDADKCQTWVDRANARAERAEAESIQLKKTNVENADSYRLMQGRVIAAEVEVERLKARLYQGCDDERDMAISEGPGHSTCGLADELTARAERAEAERDQLRAQLATCKDASEALVGSLRVEVERWEFAFQEQYARAESAEREAFDWKKIARYEAARAERAEAELALQVARNSDLFTQRDQLRAELDAERARLDWLEENAKDIMKYNCRSYIWFAHQNIRAAIDAATTEDAK